MRKPKQYIIRPDPAGVTGGIEVIFDRLKGEVIVNGDAIVEEIDSNVYVQVSFELGYTGAKLYTYIDPWGTLKVGDLVDVPTRYEDHNLAIVRKLGDGYKGKVKATVSARYFAEPHPDVLADRLLRGVDPVGCFSGGCDDPSCFCS